MNKYNISESEINRIYDFIFRVKLELIEKYNEETRIKVCMPSNYLEILKYYNSVNIGGYYNVHNMHVFGIPIQSHFENKVVVFYDHPFLSGIFEQTEINYETETN